MPNEMEAFELSASRYWALITFFDTDCCGPSAIADPGLHLVNPENRALDDTPEMRGQSLDNRILRAIYHDNALRILLDGS